jgi:imidazolonepropionase-like amidohydrolase
MSTRGAIVHHVHLTRGRTAACVAASIALAGLTQSAQPPLDLVIRVHAQAAISVGKKHQPFAISNVRVFDGVRARGNLNLVVENGIIRAVDTTLDKWRDVPTIDGSGATLLPGLLDGHAHPRTLEAPREARRFGVTTMLDMGSAGNEQLLRDAAASRSDVADLRSAGFSATAPGGHGTESGYVIPTVSGPAAAEAFVQARKASGSDYLKIMLNGLRAATAGVPNLSEDTVTALVRAAHARKMLVVAHVETQADVKIALAAGVDGLGHVWRDRGAAPEMAQRLRAQGVFVAPTLTVADSLVPGARESVAADPRLAPFLSPSQRAQLGRPISLPGRGTPAHAAGGVTQKDVTLRLEAARSLVTAGVRMLAGSDAGGSVPTLMGLSLHRELELLVKSGLTPAQALASATANVADAFRLSDRGRILPGHRADLLLVRGDPTVDITATRDVLRVWRGGVEFDRSVPRP